MAWRVVKASSLICVKSYWFQMFRTVGYTATGLVLYDPNRDQRQGRHSDVRMKLGTR